MNNLLQSSHQQHTQPIPKDNTMSLPQAQATEDSKKTKTIFGGKNKSNNSNSPHSDGTTHTAHQRRIRNSAVNRDAPPSDPREEVAQLAERRRHQLKLENENKNTDSDGTTHTAHKRRIRNSAVNRDAPPSDPREEMAKLAERRRHSVEVANENTNTDRVRGRPKANNRNSAIARASVIRDPRMEMDAQMNSDRGQNSLRSIGEEGEGGSKPPPRRFVGNTAFNDYTNTQDCLDSSNEIRRRSGSSAMGSKPLASYRRSSEPFGCSRRRSSVEDIIDEDPKVVERVGNHEGQSEDDDSTESDGETQCTENTHASAGTSGTDDTEESNERVQELSISLSCMGYSKKDIKKGKEMYRRHSQTIEAQDFICHMLEVEAETPKKEAASTRNNPKGGSSDDQYSELVNTISEMGFGKGQVANVVNDMHDSGVDKKKINIDSVLAVLLGGGSYKKQSGDKQEDSSTSKCSSRNNRCAESSSKPKKEEKMEDTLGSIEITPGVFAKLLKGRQTWNAIKNGTAVSVTCIICNVTLQCCPEANYFLCPDCDVVCPLPTYQNDSRRAESERNLYSQDANSRFNGRTIDRRDRRKTSAESSVGVVGLGYKNEFQEF